MITFREFLNEGKGVPFNKRTITTYVKEYDMYDEFVECINDANFWMNGNKCNQEEYIESDNGRYSQNGKKMTKAQVISYAFELMQRIKKEKNYSDKRTLELFNIYEDLWKKISD